MYTLDLDKCKDLPNTTHTFRSPGGGYCAVGKVLYGIDLIPKETGFGKWVPVYDFLAEVGRSLDDFNWAGEVYELNDNHEYERAFRKAVDCVLRSGLVKLKTDSKLSVKETCSVG